MIKAAFVSLDRTLRKGRQSIPSGRKLRGGVCGRDGLPSVSELNEAII